MVLANSDALHRCDIFNLLNGQNKWDDILSADGFSLRNEYKNSLVREGLVTKREVENFDFLTLEARKELASERIFWSNLSDKFSTRLLTLPYRSPALVPARIEASRLIALSPDLSESEQGNILLSKIFPYRRLARDMWQSNPRLEASIRNDLIDRADDEEAVSASLQLGINPVNRSFGLRDVKNVIIEFCRDRSLATVSPKKFLRSALAVGRSLSNGLVLALVLWEVRQKDSFGGLSYRMDTEIALITEECFLMGTARRSGYVWGGIEICNYFSPYGLKSESSVGFYVGLAHWLRCFELFSNLTDQFFSSFESYFE